MHPESHQSPKFESPITTIRKELENDERVWSTDRAVSEPFLRHEAQVLSVLDAQAPLSTIEDEFTKERVRCALISECTTFDDLFSVLVQIGEEPYGISGDVRTPAATITAITKFRNGHTDPHQPLFMSDPELEQKVRELTIAENDSIDFSVLDHKKAA